MIDENLFKELADLLEGIFEKEFEGIFQDNIIKQKASDNKTQYSYLFVINELNYCLTKFEDNTWQLDKNPKNKWLDISDQIGTILEKVKQIIGD